jgi:hypothetical protein
MDTERLDDLDPRWARLTAALRGADPPDGLSPPEAPALAAVLTAPTLTAAAAAANVPYTTLRRWVRRPAFRAALFAAARNAAAAAAATLCASAGRATATLAGLLDSCNPTVQLAAARAILAHTQALAALDLDAAARAARGDADREASLRFTYGRLAARAAAAATAGTAGTAPPPPELLDDDLDDEGDDRDDDLDDEGEDDPEHDEWRIAVTISCWNDRDRVDGRR